jgi:RimJ/RimL family protein N-acetyltransferase
MARAVIAPPLDTGRLRLRAHRAEDFEDSAGMWSDPVVVRHIGGRPQSPEEVWTRLLRYAGLWSLLGYGYWIAHDRETGRFLGEIGFADYKRDIEPSLGAVPECGWAFAS